MTSPPHDWRVPDDGGGGGVLMARGLDWAKAARALWKAPTASRSSVEQSVIPYQRSATGLVVLIVASSVIEIFVVDFLLPALWARLLGLVLGLLAMGVLLALSLALRAYPHRVAAGRLTLRYGATFELSVALDSVAQSSVRRAMIDQRRTAEVRDGVLWLPVMGVTNLAVALAEPADVVLPKTGRETVRELRFFALDPEAGLRSLLGQAAPEPPTAVRAAPGTPGWLRLLRWASVLVLITGIVLVTTGLLDWRIAAGILVVTESALAVLGLLAGAAFLRQYRLLRADGTSRAESFSGALFFLMPDQLAGLVRRELSVLRVLALALSGRTERARPGDVRLAYGGAARAVTVGAAVLLLASGLAVLLAGPPGAGWLVAGALLVYGAVVLLALGLASRARPHVLRADRLLVRWGMYQELEIPLGAVRRLDKVARAPGRPERDGAGDRFVVPGAGREALTVELGEPVEVAGRWGVKRPVMSVLLPVDDAGAAVRSVAARTSADAGGPRS
ncbi:hypothetical protein ACFU7Y_37245 [Kitasatospora sp. NPDC057542]|uniref:hypothetical protein n=1 Tax=Kitasatospora sp. NPDC057542 TaxID=3346162 RepID=UPI003692F904